jgi:hypothetical protein
VNTPVFTFHTKYIHLYYRIHAGTHAIPCQNLKL